MRTILDGRREQRVNPPPRGAEGATRRYQASFNAPYVAGDQSWTCPATGRYTVYAWGPGGSGDTSTFAANSYAGGSGGLAIWQQASFTAGEVLTISIPALGATTGGTTVAAESKSAPLTAGRGDHGTAVAGGAAGAATGGDINIPGAAGAYYTNTGNAGGGTDGGSAGELGAAGAPGYDGFRGGDGAGSRQSPGGAPGGSGRSGGSSDARVGGGAGLVIICRDK